jgi:biopolymer transport protein ExbB/TolQ
MISRNKGILSIEFLVPLLAFVFSVIVIEVWYRTTVIPISNDLMVEQKLRSAQGSTAAKLGERSIYMVIKDAEPKWEIIFTLWGMLVLGYKLGHITRERSLFKHDFIRVQPGERIIPEDALDRYKELKTAIEREPRWRERLLPECLSAALHRFHATNSVQDAANAVRERAELANDMLDSSLSLVRYIAWAIPAIGFIGTVRGIGEALSFAEQAIHGDISPVTQNLGHAFNSTFVGLTMCIILMFFLHMVQSRQESFIIEIQTFCRDKLIDVMKVPSKEESNALYS